MCAHPPDPDRVHMANQRRADEGQHPEGYEIRVRGALGPTVRHAFPDLRVYRHGEDTLLSGSLPDQSALYGVIHQLEALGVELLDIHRHPVCTAPRPR
jgi:hypothetical protein